MAATQAYQIPVSASRSAAAAAALKVTRLGRALGAEKTASCSTCRFARSVPGEFTWVHEWQVGDGVVWDERSTMHRQMPHDPSERWLMKRITIVTAKPGV